MEKGWKEVLLTDQEYKAIIARDILENNGIVVVVYNQLDSAYKTFGEFCIYVPEEMEKKSLDLLKDLKL